MRDAVNGQLKKFAQCEFGRMLGESLMVNMMVSGFINVMNNIHWVLFTGQNKLPIDRAHLPIRRSSWQEHPLRDRSQCELHTI